MTFAPGDYSQVTEGGVSIYRATKQYTLTIIDDAVDEGNESVALNIQATTESQPFIDNGSLTLPGVFDLDILDNEAFLASLGVDGNAITLVASQLSYTLDIENDIASAVVTVRLRLRQPSLPVLLVERQLNWRMA